MLRRLTLVLASAAAVALLATSVAFANTIERYSFSFTQGNHLDCSQFNPSWEFYDDYTDFYDVTGQAVLDDNGNVVSTLEHIHHVSNDVNSVTGLTLHEHNHYVVKRDFLKGLTTVDGAQGIMQRPGQGIVIHTTGHRAYTFADGLIASGGPEMSSDEDFCRAVAP